MSTCAASLVSKGRVLLLLHRRNLQKQATAVVFGENDSSSSRLAPRGLDVRVGTTTVLLMMNTDMLFPERTKLSLVQIEL